MAEANYTSKLSAWASSADAFPADVDEQGKRILLDQFANQIACAPLPWSKAFRDSVLGLGSGSGATSVYYGDSLAIDQAAFLNSAFGHGNEFDDTHLRSTTHPGAVVGPPVLALAQNHHLSGRAVLDAIVIGSEIMIRIATAASPHLHNRGHHTPPAVGPFGAAIGCSRVLGLTASQTENAMAIAGSHAGGLLEYDRTGGSVKRIHCAIPAMSGLRSTLMAQQGITGPTSVLEGERGFLKVFAGEYNADLLTKDLGSDWLLYGMAYKPFASNFSTHAPFQALGELRAEHGLTAENIEKIVIGTSHHTVEHVGTIVEPPDILGAQFSLRFGSAVRMIYGGNGFYDYREEDLHDPRFLNIARRVELVVDPIADKERKTINNRSAVVTVTTKDGRSFERRVQYSKGLPENPLSNTELTQKFFDAVIPCIGERRANELAERVWAIEEMSDAGALLPLTHAVTPAAV